MRKFYLVLVSNLLGIIIVYILFFIYTFFNFHNAFNIDIGQAFKSLENLNFHKKYSKRIHHIRDEHTLNFLFKKSKVEDLLFTTINTLEDKEVIVLFQGDSWMEQLTFPVDDNFISTELVQKFKSKKKVGFVNGGTSSYSPSLMNLQLDVLQDDFQIFPDIVVMHIDQTDIGDENCRYKHNKVYINGILDSVQPEHYIMYKHLFNYSQVYGLSEIFLNNNSKILKTFQIINFKIKYGVTKSTLRFYRKYISHSKLDKEKLVKCYGQVIKNYLINPNDENIKYFENSVREYLEKIDKKKHIKKLFIVTAPHQYHFDENFDGILNVSDIVDNVIKDKKNVTHINLSKILLNNKNINHEKIWFGDMHLNSNFHGKLYTQKILDELSKYLPSFYNVSIKNY